MQAASEASPTRTAKTWNVTERTADGQVLVHQNLSHAAYVAMVTEAVYGTRRPQAARPVADVTPITARRTAAPVAVAA